MTPQPSEDSRVEPGRDITVWAALTGGLGSDAGVELFWSEADAVGRAAHIRAATDDTAVVQPLPVRSVRRRCRLCGEPVVLDESSDPMSCYHADDANDWGDHTAEL